MSLASSPGPSRTLDELAAAAQRTLGCETAVITLASSSRSASGERLIAIAGVAGFDGRDLDDLRRGLTHLDAALDLRGREWVGIPFLAGTRLSGAGIVLGYGFASVLAAPIKAGEERLGTIYAFKREPGQFRNEALVPTVARQAAIALDHDQALARSLDPSRSQGLAALDELVLAAHNFAELARAIEEAVAPLFGAEKTGIMVWDEEREVLQMVGGSFGVSREVALSCQVKVLDPTSQLGPRLQHRPRRLLQRRRQGSRDRPGIRARLRDREADDDAAAPGRAADRGAPRRQPRQRLHRRRRRAGGLADAAGRRGPGAGADAVQAAPPGQAGGDPLLGRRRRRLG